MSDKEGSQVQLSLGDNQNRANQELLRKERAWLGVPDAGGEASKGVGKQFLQ